jgi:HlyD family secretion protein
MSDPAAQALHQSAARTSPMKTVAASLVALLSVFLSTLASGCRDSGTASAADPPRIEIKAAVGPITGITVSSPIDGRVANVAVQEGAVVRAGDVLFTMTNPAVDRELAYARAAVVAAEAKLRASQRTPRPKSSDDAQDAAAEVMRTRQAKVDRLRALLASGDVSKQELLDAETELAIAKRDWVAARDRAIESVPAADPALLHAELDRAHADESFARHRQSLLTVTAPAAGTVTQLSVHDGDDVYLRDRLTEITDPSVVTVQAPIAPELLRFVRAGATVDVKLLTIPPRTFREPIARVTSTASEGGPAIMVKVPNPDRLLRPGTPALITVQ